MTAHVTQAKIEAAVRAAARYWPGGVKIDLRTGEVWLLPEGKPTEQSETGPDPDAVKW